MLEEMKTFAMLQKIKTNDPVAVTTPDVVRCATISGASSQGRADCGVIQLGNCADLVMLDIDKPYWYPQHNLLNNLVYAAQGTDVVLTMVDGKILYEDGEYPTIDLAKTIAEVETRRKRMGACMH